MLKKYYDLTKPGIIYGNLMTAAAGFLLASDGHLYFLLLLQTLLGVALIIASGCVFNNYIDRGIDKKMSRTKNRALVIDAIPARNALIFASLLGLAGFAALILFTNTLTLIIGLIGYITYIVIYGYTKRHTIYGTVVGSVAGSAPIVAGYTAVTNEFDTAAFLLFFILTFWQMPHFYSIAMRRVDEYEAAGIPVLPLIRGMLETKIQIIAYIGAFVLAACALTFYGYTGYIYLIVMAVVGLEWLRRGLMGLKRGVDNREWAKGMFFFSLTVLLTTSVMLSVGAILP